MTLEQERPAATDQELPTDVVSGRLVLVGGIPFVATTITSAAQEVVRSVMLGGRPEGSLRLANAYSVAQAATDRDYRALLTGPGWNLPDGVPVATIIRAKTRHGDEPAGQVRGPSFMRAVVEEGSSVGVRHFLLGGTDQELAGLAAALRTENPQVVVAGTYAPPFGPPSEKMYREATALITAARPHIVWVSLGTPKQDFVARELTRRAGVLAVGIGAAFGFLAGTLPEAPVALRRLGLEWLFRLCCEPRRLWRRYLFGNVRFIAAVLRAELIPRRGRR